MNQWNRITQIDKLENHPKPEIFEEAHPSPLGSYFSLPFGRVKKCEMCVATLANYIYII